MHAAKPTLGFWSRGYTGTDRENSQYTKCLAGTPRLKKGGPWGACGLNGLKLALANFKSCWAADSLNGLKRLNGAGEPPRSMIREAPGRRRRPGSWLQPASTRPLCEHGSCQCTRLTDVSSEAGLCLITAVFRRKWRGTQRRMPARPIFLNGLKRGTLRACNLLNGNLCPQTSSFLKRS